MSSVIVIQTYDRVWIGADSAVSVQIDGSTHRLHENGRKLFHIDDKVIFCSGIMELAATIMSEYETGPSHSLKTLQKIARKKCAEYVAARPEAEERAGMLVDLMIATYDKERGKTVVHSISPYHEDFKIVDRTLNSPTDFAIWAGGIKTKQATDAAMAKFSETLDVKTSYKHAFRATSYEGIGGDLAVYEIDAAGVRKCLEHKIREKPGIKRLTRGVLEKVVAELVVAETVVGQLGNFVTMEIGVGNNVTKINTNGIASGHTNFNSAPFRVDMQGNVTANKLTANSAQINTSNLNASTWVDGYFSGNITALGEITGGKLTGALIRTAASGRRVEVDAQGLRTYDGNGQNRIRINTGSDAGVAAVVFNGSGGGFAGEINSYQNGGLTIFSNDITIGSNNTANPIRMHGAATFAGPVRFNSTVSGINLSMSEVNGLSAILSSLQSQIDSLRNSYNSHTHSVTLPTHNHGNSANQNWGGSFPTGGPR